jgi:Zn-dependent M16 (insulinase) family peptidase
LDEVIRKTLELKKLQAADDPPEAKATIPSLELEDLKREVTEYPMAVTENEKNTGVTVIRHELTSTSGIAYVNFGVDLSVLSLEDLALLPLFGRILKEAGAGDYDDVQLSRAIGTHTGGIGVSVVTSPVTREGVDESVVTDGNRMVTKLVFKGKATSEKVDKLFEIYNLILNDAKLDSQSKVIEMLKETRSRLEASIQGSGHSFCNTRMRARYSVPGYIDEKMGGISYLASVKHLLKQAEEDWPSLLARLENIRNTILDERTVRDGMFLDVTGDKKVLESVEPSIEEFLNNLPGDKDGDKLPDFYREDHPWVAQALKEMKEMAPLMDEGFIVPTQVSYVGKSGKIFQEGESVSGAAAVVSRFLRTGYLWDHVRVIGGAYGGFCMFSPSSGYFSYLSYRDPNLSKTLDVYDATAGALMAAADELEKDPEALATAIIGAVGDLDGALSPDQKGWTSFERWLVKESPEYRQKYRDEILNTTPDDFRAFAERLRSMKKPSVAVISSKAAFEAAAKEGKVMTLTEVV